jgi:hypothetical protein
MTCDEIIGSYVKQLQGEFACLPSGDRLRIITPYLYPDHDRIELFVKTDGDILTVSDLGETMRYLETVGFEVIGYSTRQFTANRIAEGLGVSVDRGVIVKRGRLEDVADLLFEVVTACKAISDLVYGSKAYSPAVFNEEVADYLTGEKIFVERHFPIQGASGSNYKVSLKARFDTRETLIATVSPRTPAGMVSKVNGIFRMWSDVSDHRDKYTLFNDDVVTVRSEDVNLLGSKSDVYRWTARETLVADLKGESIH